MTGQEEVAVEGTQGSGVERDCGEGLCLPRVESREAGAFLSGANTCLGELKEAWKSPQSCSGKQ